MDIFNPTAASPDLYAVGNYITPANATVSSGSTVVANTIYLYPFKVERGARVNELGARVNVAVASSSFQLAIYNSVNGLPASLLSSTADMSSAAATILSSTITETTLDPSRLYWFAANANAAITYVSVSANTTHANMLIGAPTLSAIYSSSSVSAWNRLFSQTYGTWPDLTGQTTTPTSGSRGPAPILRVSALL